MGKVKDGSPSVSPAKAAKAGSSSGTKKGAFSAFVENFFSAAVYKPLQGRWARLYTALGFGLIVVLGLYQLFLQLQARGIFTQATTVAIVGCVFGWVGFRILEFPPFVEFLIATEAEMNKVSWTSREDLKRSTIVVLCTVLFMTLFLFGVDWLWSTVLKFLHVIQIRDTSSLGSGG